MAGSYIEAFNGGTAFVGEKSTRLFQWTTLVTALHLEIRGIKVRRGFSALKMVKTITGLKTNDRVKQIAALQEKIDQLRAEIPVVDNREGAAHN